MIEVVITNIYEEDNYTLKKVNNIWNIPGILSTVQSVA